MSCRAVALAALAVVFCLSTLVVSAETTSEASSSTNSSTNTAAPMTTAAATTTVAPATPTPDCLTPRLNQILFNFLGTVESCHSMLAANISTTDLACLATYSPRFKLFYTSICGTYEGVNCTQVMGTFLGQPGCPSKPGPDGNCTAGCAKVNILGFGDRCMQTAQSQFESTCTPCVARYVRGMETMFADLRQGKDTHSNLWQFNATFQHLTQVASQHQSFCASVNASDPHGRPCLDHVTSLVVSIMQQKSLFPTVEARVVPEVCANPALRQCVQRGLIGIGFFYQQQAGPAASFINALAQKTVWDVAGTVRDFLSIGTSLCLVPSGGSSLRRVMSAAAANDVAATTAAPHSDTCAALINETVSAHPELEVCAEALTGDFPTCTKECGTVFADHLPKLDCCAQSMLLSDAFDSLRKRCSNGAAVVGSLPAECAPPQPANVPPEALAPIAYVLDASIPYAVASANSTIEAAFGQAVVIDLAMLTGVAPRFLAASLANQTGTGRALLLVEHNGTLVDRAAAAELFANGDISNAPQAAAVAVNAQWVEPGVNPIAGFAASNEPATGGSGGKKKSSSNAGAIAGGVVAAVVVVVVVAIVVVMRRRRARNSAAGITEQSPLHGDAHSISTRGADDV